MKLLITSLIVATATAHAGPWNPQHVSAEAKWMVHADFDGMRATTMGQGLGERLNAMHGPQLRAVKRMFSVNPLTDLAGITLYGPGQQDHAVALLDGRFDRAHIEDVVGGADNYQHHRHGEVTVHQWTDKNKTQFGAFAGDNLIVFSEHQALVHHALDVLAGKAATAAEVPFLTTGAGQTVVAGFARLAEIEMHGEESRLLRKADALRLAITEADGRLTARIAIDAAKPKTAERIRKAIDGLAAFAALADLVEGDIDADARLATDRTVEASLTMPVKQFLDLVDQHEMLGDDPRQVK